MKPEAKVIKVLSGDYVRLLAGPPESVTMQSGQSIGKHSTKTNEELLVLLEGEGTFILSASRQLKMEAGCVLYCPPGTEHDVKNTGLGILRYIFVVAKAE
jgi:mannose-6-phosphate isomerase-like protein (cupin superfamily)